MDAESLFHCEHAAGLIGDVVKHLSERRARVFEHRVFDRGQRCVPILRMRKRVIVRHDAAIRADGLI